MAALRLDLIKNYLRPHKKELIIGAFCLIFVNILSVAIPMEVRNIVDDLKEGFTFSYVLNKSTWLILLATVMGGARLLSRQLVFGVGRQVEVSLRQKLFDRMLEQDPGWVQTIGTGEVITRATSDLENIRRSNPMKMRALAKTQKKVNMSGCRSLTSLRLNQLRVSIGFTKKTTLWMCLEFQTLNPLLCRHIHGFTSLSGSRAGNPATVTSVLNPGTRSQIMVSLRS